MPSYFPTLFQLPCCFPNVPSVIHLRPSLPLGFEREKQQLRVCPSPRLDLASNIIISVSLSLAPGLPLPSPVLFFSIAFIKMKYAT